MNKKTLDGWNNMPKREMYDRFASTSTSCSHELSASNMQVKRLKLELKKSKAEVERLRKLLSDLLVLTEKNYWNSTNYQQIKEAINTTEK